MTSKSESIKVVCRVRPLNSREKNLHKKSLEENPEYEDERMVPFFIDGEWAGNGSDGFKFGTTLQVYSEYPRTDRSLHHYAFDSIQWMVDQDSMFEYVGLPTCKKFLDGMNGTIFAYGQTGSGKSYSMFGKEPMLRDDDGKLIPLNQIEAPPVSQQGLIPRCVSYAYSWLAKNKGSIKHQHVTVQYYEIYVNDLLRDLLDNGHHLQKFEDPKKGIILYDRAVDRKTFFKEVRRVKTAGPKAINKYLITKVPCYSLRDVLRQFMIGGQQRTVKATSMNPFSSRGHGVLIFELHYELKNGGRRHAKLTFADLAGSETVKKTGATKDILAEAQAINYSLSILGRVITALATQRGNPPFRDSSLSHCLRDSLAGNCRTSLVVCTSPHENNTTETLSSLNFAKRCKMIKTKTFKPILLSPKEMRREIVRLKKIIDQLKENVKKNAVAGPSGPCFSVLRLNDLDESRIKEIQQGWEKKFNIAKGKLGEDVTCIVEVDEDDDKERVTVTFKIDGDAWTLEECKRVRDEMMNILKDDPDWSGDFDKTDPITPELIAGLREENARLKSDLNEAENEVADLRAENIQLSENAQENAEVINAKEEELQEITKEIFLGGSETMHQMGSALSVRAAGFRAATMRARRSGKPDTAPAWAQNIELSDTSEEEEMIGEPSKDDREAYHIYMTEQNNKIILKGATFVEAGDSVSARILQEHNDQLARANNIMDDYFRHGEELSSQLLMNVNNYNQLQDALEVKEKEIEQLKQELARRPAARQEEEEEHEKASGRQKDKVETDADKAEYLWEKLRDKVLVKVFDNPSKTNFALRSMIHQLMEQRDYLQNQDMKYLDSQPDIILSDGYGLAGSSILRSGAWQDDDSMVDSFEDEDEDQMGYMNKIKYWDEGEVAQWVGQIENGKFAKHGNKFFTQKVNGQALIGMDEDTLVHQFEFTKADAENFIEAIDNFQRDFHSTDPDEAMKELLMEFSEAELRHMASLQMMDPNEVSFDEEFVVNFDNFYQTFHDVPKPVAIKVFSCLEDHKDNFISVPTLKRFMRVSMQTDPDKRKMINVSAYVDYEQTFEILRQHMIGVDGAKMIIGKIRGVVMEQVRDRDIAVKYLAGLTKEDMQSLFHSCPSNAWHHISQFDTFELLFCELERLVSERGGGKEDTTVSMKEFMMGLENCEVEVDKTELDIAFSTIGVDNTIPFDYQRALHLFRHPHSDTESIAQRISSKCNGHMDMETAKARYRPSSPLGPPSSASSFSDGGARYSEILHPSHINEEYFVVDKASMQTGHNEIWPIYDSCHDNYPLSNLLCGYGYCKADEPI